MPKLNVYMRMITPVVYESPESSVGTLDLAFQFFVGLWWLVQLPSWREKGPGQDFYTTQKPMDLGYSYDFFCYISTKFY